jgi:hypothetical protein
MILTNHCPRQLVQAIDEENLWFWIEMSNENKGKSLER